MPLHSHAGHFHVMGLAGLELREDLFWRGKAEIGELDDDVLPAGCLAPIPDDERRRKQKLLLKSIVRMHPIGAADT